MPSSMPISTSSPIDSRPQQKYLRGPVNHLLLVGILFALALGVRFLFSYLGWPGTDSEEGTMGLMALHIYQGHDWPIFYYGQNYMGAGEAYVAALLYHIFGVSLLTLRLAMLLIYATFLLANYLLARLLYTRNLALVSLLVLGLGPHFVITPEMRAVGGAVETLLFGSLSLLLASWLALTARRAPEEAPRSWTRWLAYAGWGLSIGLGLWSHMLILPFVACSALLIGLFCWREWRTLALPILLVGFLCGLMPLIIYNLHAAPGQDSFSVLYTLYHASHPTTLSPTRFFLHKVGGTFLYTLPLAVGITPVCSLNQIIFFGGHLGQDYPCLLLYGGWSLLYCSLILLAGILTLQALRDLWRARKQHQPLLGSPQADQREIALQSARLLLLLSGVLTLLSYANSAVAALAPQSMRYLIGLLVMTPALIAVLLKSRILMRWRPGLQWIGLRALLMALLLIMSLGTLQNLTDLSGIAARQQEYQALIVKLAQLHITHVYSGYWICDRLTFASQEHVVCGTIAPSLQRSSTVRYPSYYTAVQADPRVTYLFSDNVEFSDPQGQQSLLAKGDYQQLHVDGFVLYIHKSPSP